MTRPIRPRVEPPPDAAALAVLEQRAERLRAPTTTAKDEPIEWVAEFPVGDERYAIPLAMLRAAVPLRRVTPVPLSRPHVVGILRYQGQILSALSLASLLGIKGWSQDPAVLLVVDPGLLGGATSLGDSVPSVGVGHGRLVALDCEEIPRPIGLRLRAIEEARARAQTAALEVVHEGRLVHLLDLPRLLERGAGASDGS